MTFDVNRSLLAGMSQAQLQTLYANAQAAWQTLKLNQQAVTVSYASGGGDKHVQFKVGDEGSLVQFIMMIQAALGIRSYARRAIGIGF